ncbi:phosphate/phosphite/phosphonate ABC transporter substrate-binding protein [Methylocapsa sp. S129]|uniref:phosphate/phosphite/phosphonate ABC transporter substrate-binding protein n=1 Tax=Methylocapsa sp. S129 TaxID=1641869 RepID=UPI00131B002A|nr:PhnD/SsuA/transferrin family substrate-binding protein [Methylocapsa sp. S129]
MTDALVASLGMYDFPWTAAANDALWAAVAERLRAAGVDAPHGLSRGGDLREIWRNPKLIFGQTCGYPYIKQLRGAVALIATPIYAFAGCQGSSHRSVIVANIRRTRRALVDFAGARAAINGRDSNSGMNLFRATIAPIAQGRAFFGQVMVTGSHEASLAAVSGGEADIAAIDCVSFALLQHWRPELTQNVETIAHSPRSPALPFIMSADLAKAHLGAVRAALFAALEDPALKAPRATLGLAGAEILSDADYDRVARIEQDAIAAGYPTLA